MLDHIAIQVSDVDAAADFYTRVFAPLAIREVLRFGEGPSAVVGFAGTDDRVQFWLGPGTGPNNRELHVAFVATDRGQVEAVHEQAIAAGAEILHAPREWPEYHPGYYGVFLRDLDGNNVEAVCHRPQ